MRSDAAEFVNRVNRVGGGEGGNSRMVGPKGALDLGQFD